MFIFPLSSGRGRVSPLLQFDRFLKFMTPGSSDKPFTVYLKDRVGDLQLIDQTAAEIMIATMSIFYGAWVLVPGVNTFNLTSYRLLSKFVSEDSWGAILLAIGCALAFGVFLKSYSMRRVATAISGCVWTFGSAALVVSNPAGAGGAVTFVLAASSVWSFLQLKWRRRLGYGIV